jgi:hypothetical protein
MERESVYCTKRLEESGRLAGAVGRKSPIRHIESVEQVHRLGSGCADPQDASLAIDQVV